MNAKGPQEFTLECSDETTRKLLEKIGSLQSALAESAERVKGLQGLYEKAFKDAAIAEAQLTQAREDLKQAKEYLFNQSFNQRTLAAKFDETLKALTRDGAKGG